MSWATIANRLAVACIAPLGNAVTIGNVSGKGILRSPSESIYDGVVVVTDWMLELPRYDAEGNLVWPTVAEGAAITVDNVAFLAREQSRLTADGSSVMVPLELAPPPAP